MVRLTAIALCAAGLLGLSQATVVKSNGYAHVKMFESYENYGCRSPKLNNDALQVIVPAQYKPRRPGAPCNHDILLRSKMNDKEVTAKVAGFCDDCDAIDDLRVTPAVYKQLGAEHHPAPLVYYEFQ